MAWTYFSPELTLREMELVENKDEEYMRSFKLFNNADVNETEMKESSSSSKYVNAYCRRKTIRIERQNFPDRNQYSSYIERTQHQENSTPTVEANATNSGKIKKSIDPSFVEKMIITEGEPLLGQRKDERMSFRTNLCYFV